MTIYDFNMESLSGQSVSLSEYKDKIVLIVNVASECGLTPQYESLETFYEKHKSNDFVILGFPANNFGAQEPGTNEEIATFCERNYGVSFPMFSKISVEGKDIHPLYAYLTQEEKNGVSNQEVTWNFQKFIIGKDGKLIKAIPPQMTIEEAEFSSELETLIGK